MNIASIIVHCVRFMWHTHAFSHVRLWQPVTWSWGSTINSQTIMYIRNMLIVLHCFIHVMITIIIRAKFEHMSIWNSFCGVYLMAFLIVRGEQKNLGSCLTIFCACCICVTSVQLEEVAAALLTHKEEVRSDCSLLLVILASNCSCWFSGGTVYLCSLTMLANC